MSDGGAVFALVGFEQAVQLGGESRNPQRDMPRAVIFSMLIGATIYILLQVVFIGALPEHALAHGWANLSFAGIFGPFAGLAKGLGLAWLAYILYADAIIAPTGSGLIYTTTTSRITFGMSKNGHVPSIFEKTTKKSNVPVFGLDLRLPHGTASVPPLPRLAEAGRLHHLGHRAHVRRCPAGPRRAPPPEARRRAPLPAAVGPRPVPGVVRLGQPDHLLERVGRGLEADGGGRPRLRLDGHLAHHPRQSGPLPIDWSAAIWLWPYLAGLTLSPTSGSSRGVG